MNELNTDPQGRIRAPNDTSAPGAPGGKQIIVRHRTRTRVRSPADAANDAGTEAGQVQAAPAGEVAPSRGDDRAIASSSAEHQDALDAAKSLVQQVDNTYFSLGGVLAQIKDEGIHETIGYGGERGFADYVETELQLEPRKAQYLMKIYRTFAELDVDQKRVSEIGWSKIRELTRIPTDRLKSDLDELLVYACEHTRNELLEHVRAEYGSAGDGGNQASRMVRRSFLLFADQAEIVDRALSVAGALGETDKPYQALEHICCEWSQMTEGVEVDLQDAIATLEARYGVVIRYDEASASEVEAAAETGQNCSTLEGEES